MRQFFRQYLSALLASSVCSSMSIALLWTATQHSTTIWPSPMRGDVSTWLSISLRFALVLSIISVGYMADTLGRKKTIIALSVPLLLFYTIVIAELDSAVLSDIANFLAIGVVAGISFVTPMYIGEIAEPCTRGKLLCCNYLLSKLGELGFVMAKLYLEPAALKQLFGLLWIVCVILFTVTSPESPTFLLRSAGRTEKAKTALITLRGGKCNLPVELEGIQGAVHGRAKCAILVLVVLATLPAAVGVQITRFYVQDILAKVPIPGEWWPVLTEHALPIAMACLCYVLIDRVGRRVLLMVCVSMVACCTLIMGMYFFAMEQGIDAVYFVVVWVVGAVGYLSAVSLGPEPVANVMMGEVLPSREKGVCLSVCYVAGSLLRSIVPMGLDRLTLYWDYGVTFWVLTINCAIGILFVYSCVPETRSRSLARIQKEWCGRSSRKRNRERRDYEEDEEPF